ncbi:unnamed protein product [marine sediment metagenome]|uniref:Uncharacterized protein n=1 Tax=marine sediment metagenome TaxID=412755 RepID=X0ZTA8_9ZZZZ
MGTRITPDDPVACNPCSFFGVPAKTPCKIYAYFWEIVGCPESKIPPNMHLFTLFQDDVNPCMYRNVSDSFGWDVQLQLVGGPVRAVIHLWDNLGDCYFWDSLNGVVAEHDIFSNEILECVEGSLGLEGNAFVLWLEAAVSSILNLESGSLSAAGLL